MNPGDLLSGPYSGTAEQRDALVSWEYSVRNASLSDDELTWYLRYAKRHGERVLELACGNGRVLVPMVERGVSVDGVDTSSAMIDATRAALARTASSHGSDLFQSDMATFEFPVAYRSVQIPYNSIQYLGSVERIEEAASHWYDQMPDESVILFMTYHRNTSWYDNGQWRCFTKDPVHHDGIGLSVAHKVQERRVGASTILRSITRTVMDAAGVCDSWTEESTVPLADAKSYARIFRSCGFSVRTYADYRESAEWSGQSTGCHVARKRL